MLWRHVLALQKNTIQSHKLLKKKTDKLITSRSSMFDASVSVSNPSSAA